MSQSVVDAVVALRELVRGVDVELLPGESCAVLPEELARAEKTCAAVRAMAAARAASCGAHRQRGTFRRRGLDGRHERLVASAGEGRARDRRPPERLPRDQVGGPRGDLSLGQAGEIVKTEQEKAWL